MNGLVVSIFCALLLAVALLMVGCRREVRERDLFHPQPLPAVPGEAGRRDVEIDIDAGQSLRGWYFYDRSRPTTLIYFYGNAETTHTASHRARWMARELGVNVMVIDYRGYGNSDGTPGVDAMLQDAVRVYDAVDSAADVPQRTGVFGRSIGTAPALYLASQREVCALVLEAPFTSITDVVAAWDQNLKGSAGWLIRLKPEKRLAEMTPQSVDLMASIEIPLLILHGAEDTVIPVTLGRKMFVTAPEGRKTWVEVPGAGHNNLSLTHPEVEPALRAFLAANLNP